MSMITVRQTTDPYVDTIQYIARREVPLDPNGELDMSTIGLGQPGDNFYITWHEKKLPNFPPICVYIPPSDILSTYDLQLMTTFEDGPYPILTTVEKGDYGTAYDRDFRRREARELEEQVAYLKGLLTGGWNWVASALPSMSVTSMASQHPDANAITKGMQPENMDSHSTSLSGVPNTSGLVHRQRTAQVGEK